MNTLEVSSIRLIYEEYYRKQLLLSGYLMQVLLCAHCSNSKELIL